MKSNPANIILYLAMAVFAIYFMDSQVKNQQEI